MQKYPLCQVYKYPALSFRSLFLFFFFFCLTFFFGGACFTLFQSCLHSPSQSQWLPSSNAGCCAWVPPKGMLPRDHPAQGHPPLRPPPNFLQVISLGNQRESRREEDGRRARLAVFHLEDCRMPLLHGPASLLGWATCPKSKDRGAVVPKGIRLPSPSSPTFSARTVGIFWPWLGFKVATGAEESPRAEPRLARDAVGTHAPATRTSRRRVWSQAAAAPSRLPHNLA